MFCFFLFLKLDLIRQFVENSSPATQETFYPPPPPDFFFFYHRMTSRSYYFTQIKFNCESDGAARIGRCAHRRSQKTSRCSIARDAIHLRQPGDTATKIHTSPKKGVRSLMSCLTTKAKNFFFIYTYIFCFSFKNLKRAYINQILIRFAGHHVLIQLIHARLPGLCLFCFFSLSGNWERQRCSTSSGRTAVCFSLVLLVRIFSRCRPLRKIRFVG